MAKDCLTYDARDVLAWEPEELKLELSRLLLEGGGDFLENPVVGTLLFDDGKDRSDLQTWNNLLQKNLKDEIYYYLCVVARAREGEPFERNEGDPDLNEDFQQLLDDLRSE